MKIPNLGRPADFIPLRRKLLRRLRERAGLGAWQEFFAIYWRFVYAAARRAGLTDAEALAAVEETILAVSTEWTGFGVGGRKGAFKAWLMDLTRWQIIGELRLRQREAGADTPARQEAEDVSARRNLPDPAAVESFWEEEWERNLFAAAVERVKARVNPRYFQMFDLYVLRRWPMGKVTAALGVHMSQVYLAKHRVMGILKKELHAIETRF